MKTFFLALLFLVSAAPVLLAQENISNALLNNEVTTDEEDDETAISETEDEPQIAEEDSQTDEEEDQGEDDEAEENADSDISARLEKARQEEGPLETREVKTWGKQTGLFKPEKSATMTPAGNEEKLDKYGKPKRDWTYKDPAKRPVNSDEPAAAMPSATPSK